VGLVLQRALAVCWTVCLAVAALWAASHPLLLALGQAPEIASAASRYLILCIPCLFISTAMECMKKYLQAQRAVLPAMGAAGVATALSPLIFWYFVIRQGMGLDGAAYAFILCQVLTCAGLLGYVIYRAAKQRGQPQQTWPGWSGAAFQRWPEYLSYGIPAAAMICMEWWAYEVVILMAGEGGGDRGCKVGSVVEECSDEGQGAADIGVVSCCTAAACWCWTRHRHLRGGCFRGAALDIAL
jgi:MATE family multidrug resistance protein